MTQKAAFFRFILAFVAGFLSVLLFHQGMLALLHVLNFTALSPYPTKPTQPFGVPQICSSAFWGGAWGLVFAAVSPRFRPYKSEWVTALLFGAVAVTLVAWFVVAPLKNQPIAGGWKFTTMVTGLLVNGAWGIGTAWLLRLLSRGHLPPE